MYLLLGLKNVSTEVHVITSLTFHVQCRVNVRGRSLGRHSKSLWLKPENERNEVFIIISFEVIRLDEKKRAPAPDTPASGNFTH